MSRATKWILVGSALVLICGFLALGSLWNGDTYATAFFGMGALAGVFAIQIGVIALAVRIGTYEIHAALTGQQPKPRTPLPTPGPPAERRELTQPNRI